MVIISILYCFITLLTFIIQRRKTSLDPWHNTDEKTYYKTLYPPVGYFYEVDDITTWVSDAYKVGTSSSDYVWERKIEKTYNYKLVTLN
ncbi:MAG: hypothetical protein FH753_02595 [Firmicutes bacterium]|nr:hypothetical protein [Bacillota bacterium]